ncbi:MAG: sterol desaturase family protein [Chitinophagaceae bacterium]|nr:sterol desaturase family protein [Chitinophagaceae bacterium]
MIELTTTEQALLLAGSFLFFTLLEGIIPLLQMKYKKIRHTGINLFFIVTSIAVSIPFAFIAVHSSDWVTRHEVGVLHQVELPKWLYVIVGIMMLDFITSYLPHFVQHKVKWMWKFHLVHHTDTWVDTSTANRHHPGETVISMLFLIVAIFIIGAPPWLVILHQFIAVTFSQFTHANISLPEKMDNAISWIFISPNMHKVHHHHTQPLTDTNYGNIFSIWDRLFKTFAKSDVSNLTYGIDTYPDQKEHDNMGKLLVIPFEEYRAPATPPDQGDRDFQAKRKPSLKIIRTPIPSQQ